jgi:Aldehyde dehydrogenase family
MILSYYIKTMEKALAPERRLASLPVLANDSEYGLSASVFSRDVDRAKEIALQLDCGAVNINGAGRNYYHSSLKALTRMNRMLTRVALARPRRVAK